MRNQHFSSTDTLNHRPNNDLKSPDAHHNANNKMASCILDSSHAAHLKPAQKSCLENETSTLPDITPLYHKTCDTTGYKPANTSRIHSNKYNTFKDISRLLQPDITHFVEIDQQFIADEIAKLAYQHGTRMICKSDMGTGKTYAQAAYIAANLDGKITVIISSFKSLVSGSKERLDALLAERKLNLRSAHYTDSEQLILEADVVHTTLHNLPKIKSLLGDRIGRVIIDESESAARIVKSKIMNENRSQVIDALREIANSNASIILLDAHVGASTYAFCNSFLSGKWLFLNNKYTRWGDVSYRWIVDPEKGFDGNNEKGGIDAVANYLKDDKKIFVTTGSHEQADRIYNALHKMGLLEGLAVLRAYSDENHGDSPALTACKANHDLFNNYDLVIGTPAIGTGISIEPRDGVPHFYTVVSFFVRAEQSPDATSAMQMPFRVRKTISNTIDCVACNMSPNKKKTPDFVLQSDLRNKIDLYNHLITNHPTTKDDDKVKLGIFGDYAAFESAMQMRDGYEWENYFDVINQEFASKGMTRLEDNMIIPTQELINADKEARADAKRNKMLATYEAKGITQEQASAIEFKLKIGSEVNGNDKLSLKKFKLIRDYADEGYQDDEESFAKLLKKKDRSYMSSVKNIENSHLSLAVVNKVQQTFATHEHFALDATSLDGVKIKTEWKLDNILRKAIKLDVVNGVHAIGRKTITKSDLTSQIDGREVTRRLAELIDEWNATHSEGRMNRKALNENAVEFVSKLIKQRFRLHLSVKNDVITIKDEQPVIDLLNMHTRRGTVLGLAKLVEAVDKYDEQKASEAQELAKKPAKRDATALLREAWKQAGQPCSFAEVLNIFVGDMGDIESTSGYSVEALIVGLNANLRRVA